MALPGRSRTIASLMGFEAATLAAMSVLHLGSVLGNGSGRFDRTSAGIAEALICLVLVAGAATLLGRAVHRRAVAVATVAFAIVGFGVGLTFSIRGGGAVDVGYHAAVLPLLLLTLAALLRARPGHDNTYLDVA